MGVAIRVRNINGVDVLDVDRNDPYSGPLVGNHPASSYYGDQINEAGINSTELGIPFGKSIGALIGYKETFSHR